jgi:hypothetical protein
MRVIVDKGTDMLAIIFAAGRMVEGDEDKPGIIPDYDASDDLVSLEILDASQWGEWMEPYLVLHHPRPTRVAFRRCLPTSNS